jgi:truncated hemoglobin YjbI
MSFVDDIGGEEALKGMLATFYSRVRADANISGCIDAGQMESLTDAQCTCLSHFINGEGDDAASTMPGAHAYMIGKGMTDNAFDGVYDHYHDTLAELGIPGGMVHGFLEAFEDLREVAVV